MGTLILDFQNCEKYVSATEATQPMASVTGAKLTGTGKVSRGLGYRVEQCPTKIHVQEPQTSSRIGNRVFVDVIR